MPTSPEPSRPRHEGLRRAARLELLTIGWNVVEAGVAIAAGLLAGSIALIGFGLDSVIETAAAVVVLRRVRLEFGGDAEAGERAERRATRFVGWTFYALAAWVTFEAGLTLLRAEPPAESPLGIGLAAASLLVMPVLAWRKDRVGRALGSRALVADARETLVCAWLSLALLLGLGLNALAGLWWADPVAALAMVPFMVHEAREALE